MATTVTLDPRIQIPDSMSSRDPAHPMNLLRNNQQIQNQAAADARYDMTPPKRFGGKSGATEPFRNPIEGPPDILLAIGILLFVAILWVSLRDTTRPLYALVLFLGFSVLFLLYKKAFD